MATKLRKVTRVVLKDRSGTDNSKVAAATVTDAVKVYKQGATANATVTVTTSTSVTVRDTGRIVAGDTVQNGTDSTKTATIDSVTSPTAFVMTKVTGTGPSFTAGDRIVVTTNRPTLYSESSGGSSTGSSSVTTDADGTATFYTTEGIVDIIYSGTGITTSTEYDVEAGYIEPDPWIDIRDYGNSITAAIAALPSGGVIQFQAGTYEITSTVTINTDAIRFHGAQDGKTIIRPSATNVTYHMFEINKGGFEAHNIEFNGRGTSSGNYDIMRWNGYGVNGNNVSSNRLYDCYFHDARRNCLRATDTFEAVVEKCLFNDNPNQAVTSSAVYLQASSGSTDPVNDGVHTAQFANFRFYECRFTGNNGYGLHVDTCSGVKLDSCRFESNRGGTAANRGVGFAILSSTQVTIIGCHFEAPLTQATARANQWAYIGACRGVTFLNNDMVCIGGDTGLQLKPAYACLIETCNGAFVAGNVSSGMNTQGIVIASDCGDVVLHCTEDYGTSTDKDLISNTDTVMLGARGVMVPRFADTTARDAADGALAQKGNLIYLSSTNKFQGYNGAWVDLH